MEHTATTNDDSRAPKLSIFLSFSARNSMTPSNGQALRGKPNLTSLDPDSIARSLILQGYTVNQKSSGTAISGRDHPHQILSPVFHSDVAICIISDEYWSDPECIREFALIACTIAMQYAIIRVDAHSSNPSKVRLPKNARLIDHQLFDSVTIVQHIIAFISSPSTHEAVSFHKVFRKGVCLDSRFELEIENDVLAVEYFFRAASKRSKRAECMLGDFYLEGRGSLPVDERQAVEWYKQAVGSGDVVGITRLARMYELGVNGVLVMDTRVACDLYRRAFVEDGYRGAEFSLRRLVCNNRRGFLASYKSAHMLEGAEWTRVFEIGARFWDESAQESHVFIVGACAHVVLKQSFEVLHQDMSLGDKFGLFYFPIPDGASIVGFECDAAVWQIMPALPDCKIVCYLFTVIKTLMVVAWFSPVFRVSLEHIPKLRCVTTKIKYVQHLSRHQQSDSMVLKLPATSPLAISDKRKENIQSSALVQVIGVKPIAFISSPSHHELSVVNTVTGANVQLLMDNTNALRTERELLLEIQYAEPRNAYCVSEKDERSGTTALGVAFIPPKDYMVQKSNVAFLVDVSSSMRGVKSKFAQDSVMHLLSSLPSTFSFNVHLFGSTSKSMSPKYEALSDSTIAAAKNFLNLRHSDVGTATNLFLALESVFERNSTDPPRAPIQIVIVSDGLLYNVEPVCAFLLEKCAQRPLHSFARVFTVGVGILEDFESLERIATSGGGLARIVEGFESIQERLEPLKRALVEPVWSAVQVEVQSQDRDEVVNLSMGRREGEFGVSLFSTYTHLPSGFRTSGQVKIRGVSSNGPIELFTLVIEQQLTQDKIIHAFAACGLFGGNAIARLQPGQMEEQSHVVELGETSDKRQDVAILSQPSLEVRVEYIPSIPEQLVMGKVEDGLKRRKMIVLCLAAGVVIIVGAIVALKVMGVFG
ncbi:von Willebrand factor A domain-containing protein 5A [Chytriomyces hyalinus]|nr:von Willebrand factor A domain-containing protein 5A [Chytriomyces hyalinus]